MRIISGIYKGFQFDPGKKFNMRPTTDRNREALFNILSHRFDLEGLDVLDVFAGAGGVSYEFASRGAASVVSVEKNPGLCRFIIQTFEKLDYDSFEVYCQDAFAFLKNASVQSFDLIFADPPYADSGIRRLPELILEYEILRPGGLLIVEHGSQQSFEGVQPEEQRHYGQSTFSFFPEEKGNSLGEHSEQDTEQ